MASYQGTTITPGTDAQIAAQVAAINAGQKTTPVTPITTNGTTTTSSNPTIPYSTLTAPPQTPATPAVVTTPTAAAGAQGALTATQAGFQSQLDQTAATAKTSEQSSLDAYLKASLGANTKSGLTNDAYAKTVDPAQKALNDANQALTTEQVALRHQVEKLQASNPKGLGAEVVQAKIDQLTRESVSKQADLAVVQLAKQGAYDGAKAIADRAVNAEFEAQQAHNDALKFSFEINKDLFDKADQRAFDVAQADRQSVLDEAKSKRMAEFTEKIRESAPDYQLGLDQKRADIANTYSQIQAQNTAANGNATLNGKPQTSDQAKNQTYADRMAQASSIINDLGSKFTGAGSYVGQTLPNIAKSADRQQYEQAQLNFLNSVLRQESGAAIGTTEYKKYAAQYFPQPGDSAAVVAQKAANVNTTINGFYRQANVQRPANAGDIIKDAEGKEYKVGEDGVTITPI